jgi:hypothetical protein
MHDDEQKRKDACIFKSSVFLAFLAKVLFFQKNRTFGKSSKKIELLNR